MELLNNTMENVLKSLGDAELIRKNHLVKMIACFLIILVYFNYKYWNVYSFIDLPMAPQLPGKLATIRMDIVVIIWVLFCIAKKVFNSTILISLETAFEGILLKVFFVELLIDFVISVLFLISAITINIEYVHGINPSGMRPFIYALSYVVFSFINKEYTLFVNKHGNIYE